MDVTKASRLRMAIISRMYAEEATSVDDAEIARALAPCVCGSMLIEAATLLRDVGKLSAADLFTPEFLIDGRRVSLADLLAANADDEGLCEWARGAAPGDFFPAFVPCECVATVSQTGHNASLALAA